MTHPTQGFSTPHARELFAMGAEFMMEAHPCGHLHAFTSRPTTLPTATPKAVQDELARLKVIGQHRGTAKEL